MKLAGRNPLCSNSDWQSFVKIELTLDSLVHTVDVASRTALRGADAVHFAALLLISQKVAPTGHEVVLVASDLELKAVARASGIGVFHPAAAPQRSL